MASPGDYVAPGRIHMCCPHCLKVLPQAVRWQVTCAACERRGHTTDFPDDCPACTGLGAEAGHA